MARGRKLSLGLGRLFPNLSHPVVAELDVADLDPLFDAQRRHPPTGPLGHRQSCDYILRHAFGLAPETVSREEDLLRMLLRRHYGEMRVPQILDSHLVKLLAANPRFKGWPLDRVVPDRDAFLAFLQERWTPFLDRLAKGTAVMDQPPAAGYQFSIPGPVPINFDHADVRAYVSRLFQDGALKAVAHAQANRLTESWAIAGVRTDPAADRARRIRALLKTARQSLPAGMARHRRWLAFARRWAELKAAHYGMEPSERDSETVTDLAELQDRLDARFAAWLTVHYPTLHNQPPVPPAMVHHVPRLLARHLSGGPDRRVALLVIDGLALEQWAAVRHELAQQRPNLDCAEGAVFAWIPTLTSVSRQACLSGRAPFYFASSISGTAREPAAWRRFWADEGLSPAQVGYEKTIRERDDLQRVAEVVHRPGMRALALIVDAVDHMIHGATLGSEGMISDVRLWTQGGTLASLLDLLLDAGFSVRLTSDHGNVEARGCGRPAEGVLVDTHGKRARIYADPVLRDSVRSKFPDAVAWPSIGLPDGYHPLLAPGRSAFVKEGERPVTHGAAALEEVIVPLVEIRRT